jgi:phage-related tail fiber protein
MELRSNLDAGGLIVYNLDNTTNDTTAAATIGRVSTVESNLSASIATLESQFQAAINQMDIKTGVRVAATANVDITTGGLLTIQGVTLAATDRVLLTAQTDATQNGIYVVAVGAWTRAGDADTDAEVTSAMAVPVAEGDTANRALWLLTTPDAITLGTTSLTFQRSRNLHDLTVSGGGLNLSGSYVLSLIGTTDRVSVSGSGIDIAAGYVGQSSITTVGTIASGIWDATEIAIGKGGTGATSAAQARVNLGVAEEVSQLIGNGSSLEYTVTHNLNNENVMVSVTRVSDKKQVQVDVTVAANSVLIGFSGTAPASNSYRVAILGVKKA